MHYNLKSYQKKFTMIELASGNFDSAINLAKEASDIELENMSAPSGPNSMKPAAELYGEMLAAAGRYETVLHISELLIGCQTGLVNRRYDCSCKKQDHALLIK